MPDVQTPTDIAWEDYTLTHLQIVENGLEVASGYTEGTALSPAYHCANWVRYVRGWMTGSCGRGCAILVRFRFATTEEGLAGADWTPYFDLWAVGADRADFDLLSYILNEGLDMTGKDWVQWEFRLLNE